jgi:uncharacterized repeat protein (TIGR01451 family)
MNQAFLKSLFSFFKPHAVVLVAALFCFSNSLQAQDLQGQHKGNTTEWSSLNLQGWAELDYIPMRVAFNAGSAGSHDLRLDFPHYSGRLFSFEDLSGFAPAANATLVSGPTLKLDASGNWSYFLTVNIADSNPSEVRFRARLASGAHLYGGSSLQLKGTAGSVQIHKPLAAPGAPDLALAATGPATAVEGQEISYTLTYTNKAAIQPGTGVQVSQFLPLEITVDPATLPANARLVGNTLFWDLGNLAARSGGQISLKAKVKQGTIAGTTMVNSAQILSAENDLNMVDNEAAVITSVICGTATPVIVTEPVSVTVCPGDPVVFSVTATGPAGMSYQWLKNGEAISGATDAVYQVAAAGSIDAGLYSAVVSSPCGSATSQTAVLGFYPEPPNRILNWGYQSDRTFALTFTTGCGGTYFVEYTADFVTWTRSSTGFPGNGAPVRWIDAPPAMTQGMMVPGAARFYRVVRVY